MTSISQPVSSPQASSTPSQTIVQALSPLGSASGKALPRAAGPASASVRSVSKKPFSPTSATNTASLSGAAGGTGPPQHGKADSVNGKGIIPPAVPVVGSPAIINGNVAVPSPSGLGADHGRKPSVTISAAGASGYLPNGGPVGGKPIGGTGIQFGSINVEDSPASANSASLANPSANNLAVHTPSNPRMISPQTSPSPIPQPPASGGRPPSSFQGQGNGVNFGSLGGEDINVSVKCGEARREVGC